MKEKYSKSKNKNDVSYTWDLLIPLLLVICVLPLVVHLAVYSCGYSVYEWYSANDVLADFYCYYKSYFLDIIAVFSGIILLFRFALYKERTKPMKKLIPLFVYCGFVLLSTFFSKNVQASLKGNYESFESALVLISYVIMLVYAYQIMEKEYDYRILWKGILGISIVFCMIGFFQIIKCDLLGFSWVQKLIMSAEQFEIYGGEIEDTFLGNNVYLTLYNPNYAGVVINMLFAVVFFMFLTCNDSRADRKLKLKKAGLGLLCVTLAALAWFTYSRSAVLSIVITVILAVWRVYGGSKKKRLLFLVTGIVSVAGLLIKTDALTGFRFLTRIAEPNEREPLTSMVTDEEGVHFVYDKKEYRLYQEKEELHLVDITSGEGVSADMGEELTFLLGEGKEQDTLSAVCRIDGENPVITLYIAETTLQFTKEDDAYYYNNANGSLSEMSQVEAVDLHGLEYLGSARGYIWSRVLPMLKKYLVIGSGPDTFAEVFPQDDYAGKIVYADHPQRVIEKAHNDYLMKWVQTGMGSFICIILFYAIFLFSCGKIYWSSRKEEHGSQGEMTLSQRLGTGCYLACVTYIIASFFNDSTIQTSPFFYIFAGLAMSGTETKNNKNFK